MSRATNNNGDISFRNILMMSLFLPIDAKVLLELINNNNDNDKVCGTVCALLIFFNKEMQHFLF